MITSRMASASAMAWPSRVVRTDNAAPARVGVPQAGAAAEEPVATDRDAPRHRTFRPIRLVGQDDARSGRVLEDIVLDHTAAPHSRQP